MKKKHKRGSVVCQDAVHKGGADPHVEEMEIKILNTCVELHLRKDQVKELREELAVKDDELRRVLREARERVEMRRRRMIFAWKMLLLFLFSFGCTISAMTCFCGDRKWTGIAPVVLLILGSYLSLRQKD